MASKTCKLGLNGIKIAIFAANHKNCPAAGGSAPSVTRLICISLFCTGSKLDRFCSKKFYFGSNPLVLIKILIALLVAFTAADRFFK